MVRNANLQKVVLRVTSELNLDPSENFVNKIFQLWDTLQVRHGLMLVGQAGSGKTKNLEVLRLAISSLAPLNQEFNEFKENVFKKVVLRVLNPKSILNEQI